MKEFFWGNGKTNSNKNTKECYIYKTVKPPCVGIEKNFRVNGTTIAAKKKNVVSMVS